MDRHFMYSSLDASARSGEGRVRACFDDKWDCETCRPYKEKKEGRRIMEAFQGHEMYLSVTSTADRDRVRRLAKRLGALYVAVPCGPTVVLSTMPLEEYSVPVDDVEDVVTGLVMRLRWKGRLGSTRGFLLPARPEPSSWEAYHPSTARRCHHSHASKGEAERCAATTGETLDGSSDGWYVRRTSEWKRLGTLRVDVRGLLKLQAADPKPIPLHELVINELAAIAQTCGLVSAGGGPVCVEGGELRFDAMAWDDPRFVRFRQLTRWKPPGRAGNRWQPPIFRLALRVDRRGRVSGAS